VSGSIIDRRAINQGGNVMPEVKLFITKTENGKYLVVVNGDGFHDAENAEVGVRIRGEDEWFDDRLFTLNLGFPGRVLGGSFSMSATVPGSSLNEDWGQDEVYAIASVQGFGDFRSNTVKGNF
jgi:hypothetical protein